MLAGKECSDLDEKLGYCGADLCLYAQTLGLNTWWVGGMFNSKGAMKHLETKDVRINGVIAIGYGQTQGVQHKSKTAAEISQYNGTAPQWFVDGVDALLYVHLTQGALRFVQDYDWPGNLEQMSSVCERIILLTEQRSIDEVFVRKQVEQILPDILPGTEKVVLYKDKEAVRIAELLKKHNGNREKVAAELGVSKTTLWRHMKKYGIEKDYTF